MIVNFLLPFAGIRPIGGFKIIYEYANRLTQRGHSVNLIHPSFTIRENFINNTKYTLSYYYRKLTAGYSPKWFCLNEKVNVMWIRSINNDELPDADVIIATAWRTAKCLESIDDSKGKKFYFIQHYETWNGTPEEVNATWKMPFKKIVIARWLKEIAEKMGETAEYVPNGLDFSEFGMDTDPAHRDPFQIMMLYNELKFKGCESGITALSELKARMPGLKVSLFGVPGRPASLPEWMKYYRSPDRKKLRSLYNESAIFLSPSLTEGFGLTSAEAMMCGSALASSITSGHLEFSIDNETALMFTPGDTEQIKATISRLITDNYLRIKIALAGNQYIKQFTWEKAVGSFERILKDNA